MPLLLLLSILTIHLHCASEKPEGSGIVPPFATVPVKIATPDEGDIAVDMDTLPLPSTETAPVTEPVNAKVLAVCHLVAVSAFPTKLPTKALAATSPFPSLLQTVEGVTTLVGFIPSSKSAFKLATFVVDVTTKGVIPLGAVDVNCFTLKEPVASLSAKVLAVASGVASITTVLRYSTHSPKLFKI